MLIQTLLAAALGSGACPPTLRLAARPAQPYMFQSASQRRSMRDFYRTATSAGGSEFVWLISGRGPSVCRLRLHQRTHEDDVGARFGELSAAVSLPIAVTERLGLRSGEAGSSPSDRTPSSSESSEGEVGREDMCECLSRRADSRQVTRASMSGEPSCRRMYLVAIGSVLHEYALCC